jgi:hypothetical protein
MFVAVSGANRTVTHTDTTTVTRDPPLSASSSLQGLGFLLALNASQLTAGQMVEVNMTLTNTLSWSKNITVDTEGLPYNVSLGPCGTLGQPFGLLIAQGFYTAGNASSATPLALYVPGAYNCPAILPYSYFVFQPDSYMANGCESGGACVPYPAMFSEAYGGTWSADGGGSQGTFTPLKPGVYTVVAATEWRQIDVLHFTVASAS